MVVTSAVIFLRTGTWFFYYARYEMNVGVFIN